MSEENAGVFKVPSLPQRNTAAAADPLPPPLNYEPPANAALPSHQFTIDVIKDGSFLDTHTIPSKRTFSTFGRLPICDYPMDHSSISRYHAVLQFAKDESMPSIVDLGSSHGTFVNKQQVQPRVPQALRIGDQMRFGASSRIWILGSSDPALHESDSSTVTEVARNKDRRESDAEEEEEEDDAGETSYNSRLGNGIRPGWRPDRHAEYRKDPVKYLQSMLSESGHEYSPQYPTNGDDRNDNDDDGGDNRRQRGRQKVTTVRIELPFADEHGNTLYGTAQSQRRTDAERLACLDALEELDKRGYLNAETTTFNASDNPQYEMDSDDDFYDQTKPKSTKGNSDNAVETLDTLSRKLIVVDQDIDRVQLELAALTSSSAFLANTADEDDGEVDELDAYMGTLARGETADSQRRLAKELEDLVAQKSRLDALLRLVAPDHSDTRSAPSQPREKLAVPDQSREKVEVPGITPVVVSTDTKASTKRRVIHGPTLEDPSSTAHLAKHAKADKKADDAHSYEEEPSDNKTVAWQPPANQSGDGRTSLNDKYGY
ncbi:hypothetical protein IWW38_003438 [Coemansia aciculifera]|uniref:Uncharacterized protein n=1 Tax=Coemansia aciculifera TaxID=417176 RepID=A0ACC1M1M2_9FUNG|nr:hypothetical protein IWW38_003438 [Coemansia aciculifera]